MAEGQALENAANNAARQSNKPVKRFGIASVSRIKVAPKVYPSRFGDGKSTKVCEINVPIPVAGFAVLLTVYGRTTDQPGEVEYSPSIPKGFIAESDDDYNALLTHATKALESWPAWETERDAAFDRLTGLKTRKDAKDSSAGPPRLVKRVEPKTSQPTA